MSRRSVNLWLQYWGTVGDPPFLSLESPLDKPSNDSLAMGSIKVSSCRLNWASYLDQDTLDEFSEHIKTCRRGHNLEGISEKITLHWVQYPVNPFHSYISSPHEIQIDCSHAIASHIFSLSDALIALDLIGSISLIFPAAHITYPRKRQ